MDRDLEWIAAAVYEHIYCMVQNFVCYIKLSGTIHAKLKCDVTVENRLVQGITDGGRH